MSCRSRATTLAAVLLTAALTAPAGAIAFRTGDTPVVAPASEGTGWFAALVDSAWSWVRALVDEDNGNITP